MIKCHSLPGNISTDRIRIQFPCKEGGIPVACQVENKIRRNLFPDRFCIVPQVPEGPLIPAAVAGNTVDNNDILILAESGTKAASENMDLRIWK